MVSFYAIRLVAAVSIAGPISFRNLPQDGRHPPPLSADCLLPFLTKLTLAFLLPLSFIATLLHYQRFRQDSPAPTSGQGKQRAHGSLSPA